MEACSPLHRGRVAALQTSDTPSAHSSLVVFFAVARCLPRNAAATVTPHYVSTPLTGGPSLLP